QKEKTVYKDMLDLRDITGTATTNLYIALRASELDTEIQEIFSLSNIYFQSGSYELSPAARHTLASYCDFLKKQSNLGVKILGHADDRGSQLFNLRLSRKRAQSVADFLTACGMPREQIKIKAYGEKRPLLTGTGNEVYQQNRRVEFKIISLTNVPPSVERE
ncbi:MAG TPA: OmpA family protein, partial [Spirochaetota bacterium]|nr:OmpA family protein [Spirochaetota bacterium]